MVNPYHIPVVRGELTKNVNNVLPDVHDELEQCFPEIIPLNDGMHDPGVKWTICSSFNRMDVLHGHGEDPADCCKSQRSCLRRDSRL